MPVFVGGNHEHHGPCDFYFEAPRECSGVIKRCAGCGSKCCEEHSTGVLCQGCTQYAHGVNRGIEVAA